MCMGMDMDRRGKSDLGGVPLVVRVIVRLYTCMGGYDLFCVCDSVFCVYIFSSAYLQLTILNNLRSM